jgi:hypothetical protein
MLGFSHQDRILRTICLGWLLTVILLISASWVARITGVNHWRWASIFYQVFQGQPEHVGYVVPSIFVVAISWPWICMPFHVVDLGPEACWSAQILECLSLSYGLGQAAHLGVRSWATGAFSSPFEGRPALSLLFAGNLVAVACCILSAPSCP